MIWCCARTARDAVARRSAKYPMPYRDVRGPPV